MTAIGERLRKRLGVEAGEELVLVAASLTLFLVQWASVSATNVAETFFLKRVGVDHLPLVFLVNSLLLAGTAFITVRIAARVEQPRLLVMTLGVFAAVFLALRLMVAARVPGVFALLVVFAKQVDAIVLLVFWTGLSGLMTVRQAKRLFAPITAGGTLGTICGSFASAPLGRALGIPSLLTVTGLLLVLGALVVALARRRAPPRPRTTLREAFPLRRIRRLRDGWLFRVLVLSAFFSGVLGPILYYQFSYVADLATRGPAAEQRLLEFYAAIRGGINVGVLAIQLVGTSALFRTLGVPVASALSPLIYLLGLLGLATRTSLAAGVGAMAGATLQDHAVYDPAQRILTTLFPAPVRGAVATVVEGPVKRTGAVVGNLLVLGLLAVATPAAVGWIGVPIAGGWLMVLLLLWWRYPALLLDAASAARTELPASQVGPARLDVVMLREFERALASPDARRCRAACALLLEAPPSRAVASFARALAVAPAATRPFVVGALEQLLEREAIVDPIAADAIARLLAAPDGLSSLDRANLVQAYALLHGPRMAPGEQELLVRAAADQEPAVALAARAALARLGEAGNLDAELESALASDDAATRQIARAELRIDLLCAAGPAVGPERAIAALVARLDVAGDRARVAATLADVAARHGAAMRTVADAMRAHRDDRDAAVRAAVLRFVAAAGLVEEAPWVADRLGARDALEADAAVYALERFGSAAIEPLRHVLCTGTVTARTRALSVVRRSPDEPIDWWPAVHREIERGLALLVHAHALDPRATPAIVVRRLRERMDAHALAALFLLAALLDDPRVARAAALLGHVADGGARGVALEVLDVVLPAAYAASLLALIEGGSAGAARARGILGHAAPTHEAAVVALFADGDALTVRLLSRMRGGTAGRLDAGAPSVPEEGIDTTVTDDVDKILHLRGVELFERLTTQQLADLAAVVEEVTFRDGEAVVTEGERADCMYIVVDGRVRGTKGSFSMFEWGPHDFFGEMAVLDGGARSATGTAVGAVRLLRLDRDDILRLMDEQPAIAITVCQTLSRRLRELLDDHARLMHGGG